MSIKNQIGFFDSGIGGLTLLKCAVKILPNENFIYYGDNKNAPYGNKSKSEIFTLVDKAFRYFDRKKVKAVVIACNTVTAECVEELRLKYTFKIIGVEPAVKPAVRSGGKSIVLCTKATAASFKFQKLLYDIKDIKVVPKSNLADLIEKNIYRLNEMDFEDVFKDIINFDNIVLGCTHYIFLKDILKKRGFNKIFDGNEGTANYLKKYLTANNLINEKGGKIYYKGSGSRKNKKIFNFYINIS
jgi:glutamate racemase